MCVCVCVYVCVCVSFPDQSEVLFDIRVVDTDVQYYQNRTSLAVLSSAECDKKKKYSQACQDWRATFTPLYVPVDGVMGHGATAFI